jgi:hypothetical protein
MNPLPPTGDGTVLEPTQQPVAAAPGSYIGGATGPGKFETVYPSRPTALAPDDATARAALLRDDTGQRAAEATDSAALSAADSKAAADRMNGLMERLAVPDSSIAENMKLNGQIGLESANAAHQATALAAEALHLQANRDVKDAEDRRYQDTYARAWNPGGYWSGVRTWTPGTIKMPE